MELNLLCLNIYFNSIDIKIQTKLINPMFILKCCNVSIYSTSNINRFSIIKYINQTIQLYVHIIIKSSKMKKHHPTHVRIKGVIPYVHDLWESRSNISNQQFYSSPWKLFRGTNLVQILFFELMTYVSELRSIPFIHNITKYKPLISD